MNNSNFSKNRLKIKNKGILICNKLEYKKRATIKNLGSSYSLFG